MARAGPIRQANVLEAALAGLQERVEGLRAQDAELDRYFREMYRAGGRARAVFGADAVLVGPSTAAERLRKAPEAFGELRGGKGPLLGAGASALWRPLRQRPRSEERITLS